MWKKRISRAMGGFFCCLFLCVQINVSAAGEPDLYATSAVLMDADTGRVLYGKNADMPMAMASTTKIMTCILLLELGDLEDELSVSDYAASMPKVKLYLKKGETYRVGDLLYSLMLESHNDSAIALAEYIGKRYLPEELKTKDTAEYTVEESKQAVKAFASLMTKKAEELGCKNTYFITPNGLDATETMTLANGETVTKEHCTTATELARIMSYCILESPKKETFLKITQTPSYGFVANGRSYSCVNHNSFLNMMQGAISGKTGFTNKAGYCYVGALESDGRTFVVAILACGWPNNKTYKWSDTKELMQYGMDNFSWKTFEEVRFDEGKLNALPVEGGCTDVLGGMAKTHLSIKTGEEKCQGVLLGPGEEISVTYQCKRNLTAPVREGQIVGTVTYSVGDVVYKTDHIVTCNSVEKIDFSWCMEQILSRFLNVGEQY